MFKVNSLLSCIILSVCFACQSKSPVLPGVELDKVSVIDSDFKVPVSNFFEESPQLIPLETSEDCLVGEIQAIFETADYYIIRASGYTVYFFDKTGRFVRKIGRQGRGPNEYQSIWDVQVDASNRLIYLLDAIGRKMVLFDFDDNFVESFPLPENYNLRNFILSGDEIIYSGLTNSVRPELWSYDLKTANLHTVSLPERVMGNEDMYGNTYFFGPPENPYLYHYFNDTVYHYNNRLLEPAYLIKTGKGTVTFDEASSGLTQGRFVVNNVVQIGPLVFVWYRNVMGLFDTGFNFFYPSVILTHPQNEALSIGKGFALQGEKIFAGMDHRSLILGRDAISLESAELPFTVTPNDNPVLVKYTLK